jgi:hypothetical protein
MYRARLPPRMASAMAPSGVISQVGELLERRRPPLPGGDFLVFYGLFGFLALPN